jgi:hypothetical protein
MVDFQPVILSFNQYLPLQVDLTINRFQFVNNNGTILADLPEISVLVPHARHEDLLVLARYDQVPPQ